MNGVFTIDMGGNLSTESLNLLITCWNARWHQWRLIWIQNGKRKTKQFIHTNLKALKFAVFYDFFRNETQILYLKEKQI